jgi:hypothetical protein
MESTETTQTSSTPFPNIPPVIESNDSEYRDTGVPSTVAIAGTSPTSPECDLPHRLFSRRLGK